MRSLTWRVSRTHHRAITDPLTALYNYGFFRERLAMELDRAQLTGDPVALAMFDIDHFKHYNDTHGHQEGNRVLQKVGGAAAQDRPPRRRRRRATGARSSWRSSTAPPPRTGGASRRRSAPRWRRRGFPGESSQPLGRISVSCGVATFPLDAQDDIALIKAADARLYRAKEAGRNCTVGPEAAGT